jgi:hypothetical protein
VRHNGTQESLRFVPSRVEGLPEVTEVAVFPDRLEACSAGRQVTVRFDAIAEWPRPAWLWRLLARLGWRPRWLPVGERDFCPTPLTLYMPDERGVPYPETVFRRLQDVLRKGGFSTWDLG